MKNCRSDLRILLGIIEQQWKIELSVLNWARLLSGRSDLYLKL